MLDGDLAEGRRSPPGGPIPQHFAFSRPRRPDDASEREVGMKAVFDRDAGLSKGIGQIRQILTSIEMAHVADSKSFHSLL